MAGEKLEHLMTFVLVFMGSPRCVNNPHLRAMMAEALDAMKPPDDTTSQTSTVTRCVQQSNMRPYCRTSTLNASVAATNLICWFN